MSQHQVFILAAGYNQQTEKHCSLWSFSNSESILGWQIHALDAALPNNHQLKIVVGYHYEKIIATFPELNFYHALNWATGTALDSFLNAQHDSVHPVVAMYGDTLFHPETLAEFVEIDSDVVIAVDSIWRQRFQGRSQEDIAIAETLTVEPYGPVEYTGLIKLSAAVMAWILNRDPAVYHQKSFIDLIPDLRNAGFSIATYDVAGAWTEMNEPNDLVHFILGNKAETLRRIQPKLKKSKICDQFTCTWQHWQQSPSLVLDELQTQFNGQSLILRSSSSEEDGWETANAGVFDSILDVPCDNTTALRRAISKVFASYGNPTPQAQILIQPFITGVAMSGVLFTCDLVTGAPYYVINYDDVSGKTDSITSGQKAALRTVILFRNDASSLQTIDPNLAPVLAAAQELETILGYNKLDIEFAVDGQGQVYTFQVRPIVVKQMAQEVDDKDIASFLHAAQQQFRRWQRKPIHQVGDYTLFSGMTDWNPAEIIGARPNALANSLYRYLITDDIWAQQRAEFGYRDIRPAPLVYNFCAQPYVDCRASINSFIPSALPETVATRFANAYLDLLRDNPHLHDKLELSIVFTIWVPNFWEEATTRFKRFNIDVNDLKLLETALKEITAKALQRLDTDLASILVLKQRFEGIRQADLPPIEKIHQLIEDCRAYGTLAFSHAARAGFIAVTLLKSLVQQGILTPERMLAFQSSVSTVAGELQYDLLPERYSLTNLVSRYGHLRPGTYDVNQSAYWENPSFYFKKQETEPRALEHPTSFVFNEAELAGLQQILEALPTTMTVDDLVCYLRHAIQAREQAKFEFSKNLSGALDCLIDYGTQTLGLTREALGYLTYEDLSAVKTGQLTENLLPQWAELRKADVLSKQLVRLPGFIGSEQDFLGFEQAKSQVNYITQRCVTGELVFIERDCAAEALKGKVVAIPKADPGFDWLFSHQISGLITQYGGANSHMAIRCAELGIPAAIGVGDKLYESLRAGRVFLDCQKEQLIHV